MSEIPMHCQSVKCMQTGCKNQAMHKVGEYNIFNEEETDEHKQFSQRHELTTYLCDEHFNKLMKREEFYGDISKYKHHSASLDGCPFNYCDSNNKDLKVGTIGDANTQPFILPSSQTIAKPHVSGALPLNTKIVSESLLHEERDKSNPNKYPVSAFSFRQGALWFKSMIDSNHS